jgi:hypothetical protein
MVELTEDCSGTSNNLWGVECGGACPTAFIFGVFSQLRRVTLRQCGDYHVAIKAQDIRAGSQRSL